MKEFEITQKLTLTDDQVSTLDMHTFINIVSILYGELQMLSDRIECDKDLGKCMDDAFAITEELHTANAVDQLRLLQGCSHRFSKVVGEVLGRYPSFINDPEVLESLANIDSIESIMDVRIEELLARYHQPMAWQKHTIASLMDNFISVLAAIEKNSKGAYRIIYNMTDQEERDYYVNLNIESVDNPFIFMPPVIQDVFRDLIANARKYTSPGGRITAGLYDDGKQLTLNVEDSGMGIPEDQILEVVDFGRRAQNAFKKPTRGGGFGLTKAYFVTLQFGGRMWISSKTGAGTRVKIQIPH